MNRWPRTSAPSGKGRPLARLELSALELSVLRAVVSSGLEELAQTGQREGPQEARLTDLQKDMQGMAGPGPFRLALQPGDASLLRGYVSMVMAMRGYVVGRPQAINTLALLQQRLERMEKPGRLAEMRRAVGAILHDVFLHGSL